jgi:hypothetical protein
MSYSVDWSDSILDALAAIWTAALDRQAVTRAEATIHFLLGTNPYANGTLVSEGLYAIEVPPLRALFEISAEQQVVKVVSLREVA